MKVLGKNIDEAIDQFLQARDAIFAHVGYVERVRVLPLEDSRDQFWAVHSRQGWVRFSARREPLAYAIAGHPDGFGPYGDVVYENAIYTQRHLPRWVYRGAVLTMIVVDTQSNQNQLLQ